MVDGIALVDRFGWDAYNEGTDLTAQIEHYKSRYGHYPQAVLGDGIYGTRANRNYMKSKGIRFGGKPLGRPKKQTEANAEQIKQEKLQRRQDALERIPVEGEFGQGKNGYRLNYIRAKTQKTSEAWLNSIFRAMNLMVLLRICFLNFFDRLQVTVQALLELTCAGILPIVSRKPMREASAPLMG